jgi:N-acetylglucosaminyldiphosphoundecaprenol N-acetyl-beta-D-mannosaminyltransferase
MKSFLFNSLKICSPDDLKEIQSIFKYLLERKNAKYISFINPEIFLSQEKNAQLHKYFQNASYNFIDGIGLLLAINDKLGTKYSINDRYPGTDFFTYLPSEEINVFLYGSEKVSVVLAKENIEKKYSNIHVVGFFDGYTEIEDDELIGIINESKANILIVCKGYPLQEIWIKNNINKLNVSLVFGNGGAFDFWSGKIKRAPEFMIKHGFEWMYRLFQNFTLKRINRQLKLISFFINYKFGKYDISIV